VVGVFPVGVFGAKVEVLKGDVERKCGERERTVSLWEKFEGSV
jgi:hypothetical protein